MNLPALPERSREMASQLQQLGFDYVGRVGKKGHLVFTHPEFGDTRLPCTPSRDFDNVMRSQLARQMGTTKLDLEIRLGLKQRKREGPKVRRERNEAGRQARRFEVVRDVEPETPARVGTPQERMAEIARDRKEAEGRQARAAVGSDAYRCALDDISRCRREYLEAEIAMKEAA